MAVVSVHEIRDQRSGSVGLNPQTIVREYTRTFRVTTSDAVADDAHTVLAATGLPAIGDTFPTDDFAAVMSGSATCDSEDGCTWVVTISYGQYNPAYYPTDTPLSALPRVRWAEAKFEEICDFDIHDDAIVNSAGDPFDPPITRDQTRPVLEVVRNEASYSPDLAEEYRDKLNSDTFGPFAIGTVKVASISSEQQYDPRIGIYYSVAYTFEIDRYGWKKEVLDAGFRKVSGSNRLQILDAHGTPVTSPVLLDGAGNTLPVPVDPAAAVVLSFDIYESISFATSFSFPATIWS